MASEFAEAAAKAAAENEDNRAKGSCYVNRLHVPRPHGFDDFLQTAQQILASENVKKEDRIFCLFTGKADETTGESWCPDCDKAKPVIEEALSKVSQPIVLLECPVEREEYKNNKDYVYRTHSLVKLESLPTLIRIGSTRATARLGESECSERELVEEIFNVD